MNILTPASEYADTLADHFGGADLALEHLGTWDPRAQFPHVPAMFWDDVRAALRLWLTSDETVEQAEERWARGGAFIDETRRYWFSAANVMGYLDAHVREYLAQGIEGTGIDMANASWWDRHPEKLDEAMRSHDSF